MFRERDRSIDEMNFQRNGKNGELIFDDLESQTRSMRLSDDGKKEQSELLNRRKSKTINLSEYMSEMETKNPVSFIFF